MKEKIHQYVQCNHCKDEFSTEEPNFILTPCSCGKISVDTNEHYARTIGEVEDYNLSSNDPKIVEEWMKVIDEHFKARLN